MDLSHSLLLLLTFFGFYAAANILPQGPVVVGLGGNVTLKTLLKKPAYLVILWNFNDGERQVNVATLRKESGLQVNPAYQGRASIDEDGGLILYKTTSADSGDYDISVIPLDGPTTAAAIELRVLEPVSNVNIKSDPSEAVEHNSTVVLTCSAKGSFLQFTWTNGTKTLIPDGKRITLKEDELSSTISIAGVLRWDLQGPISCQASNKLGSKRSAPFNLTVYYGPEQVVLTPPTPPAFIKLGSDFNLTCAAVSSPAPTLQWFHGQQLMKSAGPVLTLKQIQDQGFGSEAASYTCRASNSKTKRVSASNAVSFAVKGPIAGVKISGPSGLLLAGNSSANLSCRAEAGEVVTSTWKKDGKALTSGGRVRIAADGMSVRVAPLEKEDNGLFLCELKNQVDSQTASYQMVVTYGPEEPRVTGPEATEVNDRVTLTCSAPSVPPANFTWTFNGSVTPVTTATYVIDKVAFKDTGTYACEAHNAVTGGRRQSKHFLSVKEEGALEEGLSDGAIAGIVIAVLLAVGGAIGLFLYCRQKVPVESPY